MATKKITKTAKKSITLTATTKSYFIVSGRLADSGDEDTTLSILAKNDKDAIKQFVKLVEADYDDDEVANARLEYGNTCFIITCIQVGELHTDTDGNEYAALNFKQFI